MDITSKSLYHANFVLVFRKEKFAFPDHSLLFSVYQGEKAAGARFIDDPILKTKVLDLPALKIQIAIDPNRLRLEDFSQQEPPNSNLVNETLNVYQQLFSQAPLISLGFNFDIYYRSSGVIQLRDLFNNFADSKILEKGDLRDVGVQFTLDKGGGKREVYFLKIIAPLEIAVHVNHHFPVSKLPEQAELNTIFEKCYDATDEIIENLKL